MNAQNSQIPYCSTPCFPDFLATHRSLLEEIYNQNIPESDKEEIQLEDFALDVFAEVYSSSNT